MTTANGSDDSDHELEEMLNKMEPVSWMPMAWILVLVVVVWFAAGFTPWFLQERDWPWKLEWGLEKAGEFGDSFGFINSLFSSLALWGVVAAIWLQRKELMEQRKELVHTRLELKRSRKAQQESQQELEKQANINQQATILNALQGLQDSAENPKLYDDDEAKPKLEFVEQLRELVVLNILRGGDIDVLSGEVNEQLTRWGDLTFVMTSCKSLLNWIAHVCSAGDSQKGTWSPIKDPNKVDATEYRMLLDMLDNKVGRICAVGCGGRVEESDLTDWLANAREKLDAGDNADLLDRLKSLQESLATLADDAKYARAGTFGHLRDAKR